MLEGFQTFNIRVRESVESELLHSAGVVELQEFDESGLDCHDWLEVREGFQEEVYVWHFG